MKKEDYVFCIGYQGDAAVVDGQAKKKYARSTVKGLLDEGLFKFALCSAIYDEDQQAIEQIIEAYNRISGLQLSSQEEIMKILGVTLPSEKITKTVLIK